MQRSKCGCLTQEGRPCSRDSMMDSEFCWQHDLVLKEYINELPKGKCYDPISYQPVYTVVYTKEELEVMTDQMLTALYNYYDIEVPYNRFRTVLLGEEPYAYGSAVVYRNLTITYPNRELSYHSLLVEGLLYYYRILDKYGINPDVLSSDCRQLNEIPDLQPVILNQFRAKYMQWFVEQAEQLLPFDRVIDDYAGNKYVTMNDACRGDNTSFLNANSKLMHAFTLSSPLPTDILVFRQINIFPRTYSLTGISQEKGFMSTTLMYRPPEELKEEHVQHYLQLYLPMGTRCLNLCLYNAREQEILLPPGTTFKIYDSKVVDGKTNVYYAYLC